MTMSTYLEVRLGEKDAVGPARPGHVAAGSHPAIMRVAGCEAAIPHHPYSLLHGPLQLIHCRLSLRQPCNCEKITFMLDFFIRPL